jgi:hypothetical protein
MAGKGRAKGAIAVIGVYAKFVTNLCPSGTDRMKQAGVGSAGKIIGMRERCLLPLSGYKSIALI